MILFDMEGLCSVDCRDRLLAYQPVAKAAKPAARFR